MTENPDELADDVAAASAAYALNVLNDIIALPASEVYQRLYDLFRVAILAYTEGGAGWQGILEPSSN